MTSFLTDFVAIMLLVVVLGYFNEKVTKLTDEIALMLFAIVIGAVLFGVGHFIRIPDVQQALVDIQTFDLEDYLMDCVLCFMLFAGSCHMRLRDFHRMARQVSVLAFVTTLLGSVIYGGCFYGIARLLQLPLTLPMCLMFGSIVAPTDPIAATSILKKFGLPKDISFLIEGESLLNDGVGVALFVCFSGIVKATEQEGVAHILLREVCGAVAIGVGVSLICIFIFARTGDYYRKIFASLLAVSSAYLLCQHFDCSGAIASVVCGVLFSTVRRYEKDRGELEAMAHFDTFWNILDNLLNAVLYVMLGLSFISVFGMPQTIGLSLVAIVCNMVGRFGSVGLSTLVLGPIPDGYDRLNFTRLLTWGGLRGGLCIALAMSVRTMVDGDIYKMILAGTYAIVFFTTVIQGLTMKAVYERIRASVEKTRG